MKIKLQKLKRIAYISAALTLALAGTIQGLFGTKAYATPSGGQVQSRSIIISSSVADATGVSYQVSFKPQSNYTMKGIILEFCDSGSVPIIDDSDCTSPAGFSVGGATPSFDATTSPNNIGSGWSATGVQVSSVYRVVSLTNSTGLAVTSGTTYTFTLTNVTNQTAVGTFFARLVTYTSDSTGVTTYTSSASGADAQDYGGFALSTAYSISITAKVAEAITFCVSGTDPGTDCAGVTAPTLTLGHPPNNTLDSSAVDTAQAWTQLSTNANGGAIIRMKSTAASGGLNFGSNSIPPTGDAVATITAGTAAFGMRTGNGTGGTGTITADTNYSSATQYGMDASTGGADVTSVLTTYGDPIASSTAPVNNVENLLTFAATASNTTPAGTYSTTLILMASGTF